MNSKVKQTIIENLDRCICELNKEEYDASAIEDLIKIQTYLCEVLQQLLESSK